MPSYNTYTPYGRRKPVAMIWPRSDLCRAQRLLLYCSTKEAKLRGGGGTGRGAASSFPHHRESGARGTFAYLDTLVGFLAGVLVATVQAFQTDGLAEPDVHPRWELRQDERRDKLLL